MALNRNDFLESLAKDSPMLNVVFLNHSGIPEKLQTDLQYIALLADEAAASRFIKYCSSGSQVSEVLIKPRFMEKDIQLHFKDGTELNVKLIRKLIWKSLNCLTIEDVFKDSSVNDFGMLCPSHKHHFEYLLLTSQFAKIGFPDKFRKYFSGLAPAERTEIFRYIHPKYNLVLNTIEDVYQPKNTTSFKLMIGLRHMKANSLFRIFFRVFSKWIWEVSQLFSPRIIRISPTEAEKVQPNDDLKKKPIGHVVL